MHEREYESHALRIGHLRVDAGGEQQRIVAAAIEHERVREPRRESSVIERGERQACAGLIVVVLHAEHDQRGREMRLGGTPGAQPPGRRRGRQIGCRRDRGWPMMRHGELQCTGCKQRGGRGEMSVPSHHRSRRRKSKAATLSTKIT